MKQRRHLVSAICVLLIACSVPAQIAPKKQQPDLDQLVEQREYPELERVLPAASLDQLSRDYFEGVLANRRNELQGSIDLLQPLIPKLKAGNPHRAAVALRSLADDYVKMFRYAEADRSYGELLSSYAGEYRAGDRQSLEDDAKTVHLLKDAPPQTVEMNGTFTLETHHSKVGTIDTNLTVAGVTNSWILDTGANFSVVIESVAKKMGLKLSEGAAQTQGASGAENSLHTAIIPEIKIGTATVHNVVVLVMPDESINVDFGSGHYQIEAIVGYPVLSALGQLTFTHDNHVVAGGGGEKSGSPIYMQQLNPLLQCGIEGRNLLLMFDTGADNTTLTAKYYRAFRSQFSGLTQRKHGVGGAGGVKSVPAYVLPELRIDAGGHTVTVKDVSVLTEALGSDADLLYGTVGRDLSDQFKSFTLDFKSMRFRLEK